MKLTATAANKVVKEKWGPTASAVRMRTTDANQRFMVAYNDIVEDEASRKLVCIVLGMGRSFDDAIKMASENPLGQKREAVVKEWREKLNEQSNKEQNEHE